MVLTICPSVCLSVLVCVCVFERERGGGEKEREGDFNVSAHFRHIFGTFLTKREHFKQKWLILDSCKCAICSPKCSIFGRKRSLFGRICARMCPNLKRESSVDVVDVVDVVGQSGLEAKILASASASRFWPRPGLDLVFLLYIDLYSPLGQKTQAYNIQQHTDDKNDDKKMIDDKCSLNS